ncbi:unnamed protein product [Nezara viridula]|uniref:Uncharacterized protein n=1 Tax=Nezara viridula TaxID=85310 RepID=A0A9P0HPE5_NEZVI|nr:unnamed protein product [Nezara viridula]
MDKRKPSEAVLVKKILLLRQKYKQQNKEERIFMKRNKKLVKEIQYLKERSKSLNDERLTLQKDVYDKKYAKAGSEGSNIALKNSLSSFLNDLHALQTKVINSWKENQKESLVGNRHSSKKPAESCPQESVEQQTLSEDLGSQSRGSSPLKEVSNSQNGIMVCKIEALNGHEVEPVLTNHCDLSESKEELTLLLSSFCRRDTVPIDKPTGPVYQEYENMQLDKTCKPDFQVSENVSLERTCEPEYQEPENVSVEKTIKPDLQEPQKVLLERISNSEPEFQESENVSLEETCETDFHKSPNLSLERTCELDHQESANVSLEVTCEPDHQESENVLLERACNYQKSKNEVQTIRPIEEEPFHGFQEDSNEKAKFTFESNPEITTKEAVITSTLEVDLSKYYKIQQLEVSIPRLDLSAYPSLNSTIEIPKKDVSRRRKSMKSNQDEDRNKRDATPDSASESSNNVRLPRRARNAVSYKEKPLKMKLRRS